jgi:hypothetical protein
MSLVDGPLGPEEPELLRRLLRRAGRPGPRRPAAGLGAHLAGCLACREEHESLRALLATEGD